MDRLQWKNQLIAERTSRITEVPLAYSEIKGDLSQLEYRRVHLTGEFLHDKELYLAARSLESTPGYHVITPFRLDSGNIVLLNRGFVSIERKDPSARRQGQIEGTHAIEGIIRLPRPKAWMQPKNEPQRNLWFYIDLDAMWKAAGLPEIQQGFYLDATVPQANPGGWPKGGQTRISLPNDHLQYAITWALLAVALAVIYIVYHVKRERNDQ